MRPRQLVAIGAAISQTYPSGSRNAAVRIPQGSVLRAGDDLDAAIDEVGARGVGVLDPDRQLERRPSGRRGIRDRGAR